ncbi:MAG: site-2 protease family protein [Planctomycetota bacterium]|jgi:regulator of sigma E protease
MSQAKEFVNKYSRVIILALVLIAILCLIILNLGAFGNVLLVLLGFGAVVMVHEFGHFVAAKVGGIKVEAFSIFMPPILFGIQRTENGIRFRILPEILPKDGDESGDGALSFTVGSKGAPSDTEYRIGLIPFGGFVKMLGQDDTGPASETDDPRSFMNKPLLTRAAVLAAGVTCNIISAVIIFMIAFLVGISLPPAVVGGAIPGSPAALAGLQPGDEIVEIAGKDKDLDFGNIAIAAALSGKDEKVPMTVRRVDGSKEEMEIIAKKLFGQPMRGFGILEPMSLDVARLTPEDANTLETRTGLLPGDRVESVNGKPVTAHWELSQIISNTFAPEVTLSLERKADDEVSKAESRLRLIYGPASNPEGGLSHVYSMVPRLRIEELSEDYEPPTGDAATRLENGTGTRLENGDIILAIGDVENPTYDEMRDVTTANEDKELVMKVLRQNTDGTERALSVTVIPRQEKGSERVVVGFLPTLDMERPVIATTIAGEGGPAKLDIPRGAVITAVDGAAVANFYDIIREIRRYPDPGQDATRITIDWRLDAETAGNVAVNVQRGSGPIAVVASLPEYIPFVRLEWKFKADGPVDAVVMGYRKTVMFVAQTYVTLRRLVGGLVSPKNLMGPLGIISMSYKIVDRQPFIYYVYFLGLINAVIAVFNFLPLPPLDGGLVVLLLVEKVRGAAFSERVQGVIAYTGWILILALFLYVTFNDILRTFFNRGF